MRLLRPLFLLCLMGMFIFLSVTAVWGGARLKATPNQLRALYVQRLVKYVTWPEGAGPQKGKPVIVAAADPAALRPFFPKNGTGPSFKLVQWPADHYHVLVLNGTPEREAAAILKRVIRQPVLTIGENPVNLQLGGVINFYMRNGKLKLQINLQAANEAGLTISSKLLKIAWIYVGEK